MVDEFVKQDNEHFKVLEFYSGVGGMRYSLLKSGINAEVVQAFEINDVANDVYQLNFDHRPFQGNIQSLSVTDLDKYQAHVWLLSPPCQPYTRQGLQKDSSDARAFSFLNILELIPQLTYAPLMLFVENVVGFETSDTHNKMIEVLVETGYVTQEFILSPLQFGVPYSRPRYFCLAKRKPLHFKYARFDSQLLYDPAPLFGHDSLLDNPTYPSPLNWDSVASSCEPVQNFLEFKCHVEDEEIKSNGLDQYLVPRDLIDRWGSAMGTLLLCCQLLNRQILAKKTQRYSLFYPYMIEDTVYADSKRCCCFTKSYYRYVKGTGSLLATIQPELKGKASPLEHQGLRYFTPREVANLHSFPKEFRFPDHISLRQRYALLGNSLSVAVVGPLIKYLLTEPFLSATALVA